MAGTTQPGWSEGLRAQEAMLQPMAPHTVAETTISLAAASSKDGANAVSDRG